MMHDEDGLSIELVEPGIYWITYSGGVVDVPAALVDEFVLAITRGQDAIRGDNKNSGAV